MKSMKSFTNKLVELIFNSNKRFLYLSSIGFYNYLSDEEYIKRKFKAKFGTELDLENPITFNEKLQWLKLYNRRPEYTMMVDKYKVREYIKEKLGEEYLIPLLGVWNNPDEIDFDALPNQFVLKCNHNSGLGMCICRDKSKLNLKKVKADLKKGLKQDYYLTGREWPYKDVPRKITCEKYMSDGSEKELRDYKVLCFNGVPKLVEIHNGRFENHTQDFYDANTWERLNIIQPGMPLSDCPMEKPGFAEEMNRLSAFLAKDIPHVRVDWYFINNHLYFGELTFFDGSGFDQFCNPADDIKLGEMITLPSKIGEQNGKNQNCNNCNK